jgi:hypothetical protein
MNKLTPRLDIIRQVTANVDASVEGIKANRSPVTPELIARAKASEEAYMVYKTAQDQRMAKNAVRAYMKELAEA